MNTQIPTTEAGKALAHKDLWHHGAGDTGCGVDEVDIVAIEDEARAQGRKEAPRDPWIEAADHPESRCQRCGGPNVWSWSAPSPLWNAVMRDPDTGQDSYGIVCPPCFSALASLKGLGGRPLDDLPRWHWRFRPEIPDEEITALWTDSSGLQWDPESWLWVEAERISNCTGHSGGVIEAGEPISHLDVGRLAQALQAHFDELGQDKEHCIGLCAPKVAAILDRVAALNASESPPRVSILDSDPAEGEGMDDWLGDASESPPTDPLCAVDICAHPSHSVGDASESVQPPESHDDE